ncbi:ATP-binding cassette domain-containing protein [Streptococcus thermophilus]|uniref:ATP-binding cassette domain-containing protein n=1 Tax=Streptococcus thermophilus TaxID=1308 RepID=UPI001C64BD7A|nr:ATP-binding cassette domain-containing protein [Streptococcus thermophilus]MBW7813312.1 ATP-binding cassette domain-containing protein [Streptococcus thermophilus]MCT3094055.1 ATP-binding cassette domain-containing protein [Streptococcus thermophilus]
MDNISLTLKKGNIAGLIGNNGAGKTTLMKLISGIVERPNGTIDLNTKTVGALIEAPALYPNMTVEANLKFYCRLYHKDYSSIDCDKEDLEVATYLKRKASKLSLGMKQRVGLFIALIASDEFILLDEPT